MAFTLASGTGSAYNPVRAVNAAPGASRRQSSSPLALRRTLGGLRFPTVMLGPPALHKAGCLPTPSLILDQRSVLGKEPHLRSVPLSSEQSSQACSSLQSVQSSSQARISPLGLGPRPSVHKGKDIGTLRRRCL